MQLVGDASSWTFLMIIVGLLLQRTHGTGTKMLCTVLVLFASTCGLVLDEKNTKGFCTLSF